MPGLFGSFPKPICAVCNREVEDLRMDRDLLTDEVVFTAVCHGARERVPVAVEVFGAPGVGISVGRAFNAPALPAAPALLTESVTSPSALTTRTR